MRIALLHNPTVGSTPSRAQLMKLLRRHGHEAIYYSTKEKGGEEIGSEEVDLVLVAGGDGSVAKAVKLLHSRVPIALLPLGTANNIAHSLGVTGTPEEIVAGLPGAGEIDLDVAVARARWGDPTRFVESTGVGLFAALLRETGEETAEPRKDDPELDPITWGRHKLRGLVKRVASQRIAIELDDQDLTGDYLLAAAMNISHIGPRLRLAPSADPGDGMLDLVLVRESDRVALQSWLDNLIQGAAEKFPLRARRGRRIRMEWSNAQGHLDDELWPRPGSVESVEGMVTFEIAEPARILVSE